ncbi:hypothetical protein NFI96_030285 [Prochilodus magdalenae]|nr:hypothetical protein NFI96_030285 [Prochilodus magdalenae]
MYLKISRSLQEAQHQQPHLRPAVVSCSDQEYLLCQSAVQKADFISALASHHSLHFLALTETWITPENSSTLAALSSAFNFTETGWHSTSIPHLTVSSPTHLHIIVIYRPPCPLGNFIDELDTLLSLFPVDGSLLFLLGEFNLPSDELQLTCLEPLLSSFDLTLNPSPPTHRGGNTPGPGLH